MKILFLSIIGQILASVVLAQPAYDAHGRVDPMVSIVTKSGGIIMSASEQVTVDDLVLEGFIGDDAGKNLAIINGKIVRLGDQVVGHEVSVINANNVILVQGEKKITLELKKKENQ